MIDETIGLAGGAFTSEPPAPPKRKKTDDDGARGAAENAILGLARLTPDANQRTAPILAALPVFVLMKRGAQAIAQAARPPVLIEGEPDDVLAAVAADPGVRVSELPLLPEAERWQILEAWNDTPAPAWEGPVHELFARACPILAGLNTLQQWLWQRLQASLGKPGGRMTAAIWQFPRPTTDGANERVYELEVRPDRVPVRRDTSRELAIDHHFLRQAAERRRAADVRRGAAAGSR